MATIKTDAELLAQTAAGLIVNGNREITPPIHKSIEDNIIASKLSIKDGGNVVQVETGYTTELPLTDNKSFVYKGYVDGSFLRTDGMNSPVANINWDGFEITNAGAIETVDNFVATSASMEGYWGMFNDFIQFGVNRNPITGTFHDLSKCAAQMYLSSGVLGSEIGFFTSSTPGAVPLNRFSIDPNGLGTFYQGVDVMDRVRVKTGATYYGSIKSDNLTADITLQFPNKSAGSYTIATTSDISGLVSTSTTLNINGVTQSLAANREWRTAQADTGALTYAGITVASGTTVNIGACTGYVINNETTPGVPVYTYVNYAGELAKTVTTVGGGLGTYVLLNSSGTIVFQNTFPTSAQRKTHIYLSKIGHPTGTVLFVTDEVDFITSPLAQSRDWFRAIKYINQGVYASANGANLNFNLSAGTIVGDGINFVTDKTTPNYKTVAGQTPCSFYYRTQTGAGGGAVTAIDPTIYDLAGVSTAIPGSSNQATLVYIYYVPGIGVGVQPGQTIYSTLTSAIGQIGKESFVQYPSFVSNSILIGILAVTKGCTLLNDTTTAQFFRADIFGQAGASTGGTSVSTMQQTYNNSGVVDPQILTNTANDGVKIRRGSAADTDNVLVVQNGAGTATFTVDGNGLTKHGTLQLLDTTYKTALTVSGSTIASFGDGFATVRITNSAGNRIAWNGSTLTLQDSGGTTLSATITAGLLTFPSSRFAVSTGFGSGAVFATTGANNPTGTNTSGSYWATNSINGTSTGYIAFFNAEPSAITAHAGDLIMYKGTLTSAANRYNAKFTGAPVWLDDTNIQTGTTTGTKIGTATSQKLSFWNATPVVQPTTAITAAAFVANTSGTVNDTATYGGYTLGQIAAALKQVGILA